MNEQKSLITQPVEPEYELLVNNIIHYGRKQKIMPHFQ